MCRQCHTQAAAAQPDLDHRAQTRGHVQGSGASADDDDPLPHYSTLAGDAVAMMRTVAKHPAADASRIELWGLGHGGRVALEAIAYTSAASALPADEAAVYEAMDAWPSRRNPTAAEASPPAR